MAAGAAVWDGVAGEVCGDFAALVENANRQKNDRASMRARIKPPLSENAEENGAEYSRQFEGMGSDEPRTAAMARTSRSGRRSTRRPCHKGLLQPRPTKKAERRRR